MGGQLDAFAGKLDAVPYGAPPEGAIAPRSMHGVGVPVVSGTPWNPPYEEWPACAATTRKGNPCKDKADPRVGRFCGTHRGSE